MEKVGVSLNLIASTIATCCDMARTLQLLHRSSLLVDVLWHIVVVRLERVSTLLQCKKSRHNTPVEVSSSLARFCARVRSGRRMWSRMMTGLSRSPPLGTIQFLPLAAFLQRNGKNVRLKKKECECSAIRTSGSKEKFPFPPWRVLSLWRGSSENSLRTYHQNVLEPQFLLEFVVEITPCTSANISRAINGHRN